jgi:hypothetical protein
MLAEIFAAILEAITPKSRVGKIVWGVLLVLVLAIAVIEILGAAGY